MSPGQEPVKFRSRTATSLLAYLAINKDREFSSDHLHEMFWPESDGDRQGQNLRRAVADLRAVLEENLAIGTVVVTRKGYVSINRDRISTDLDRFHELSKPEADADQLTEAQQLYSGPLLPSLAEGWVVGYRMEAEERFGQVVERLCGLRLQAGSVKEAIRIGRSAVLAAPHREDIHIALISAYRHAGMETEAIRQFEELERILDEHWGEPPSERAQLALEGNLHEPKPYEPNEMQNEEAGGAVALGSPYYVRRQADSETEACVRRGESVVLIQGPRQVGKSSLLARVLEDARKNNIAIVLSDLQTMGESQLLEEDRFYKTLAHLMAAQLGIAFDLAKAWSEWLGPNLNLDAIIGNLLERHDGPVCWAIDEADLLFDRPYTNDFFGLLRSWHNRRALDPAGPWSKLTLILTYATEAHLFISDLNQSPFNVGVRINLQDFTDDEVRCLQRQYAGVAEDAWRTVSRVTHGHPYLVRRAFTYLAKGGIPDVLERTACQQDGPFGDHLHHVMVSIAQDPVILKEVRRMLNGEPFELTMTRYRLWSSGIVSVSNDGGHKFRVPAYEQFVRAEIR